MRKRPLSTKNYDKHPTISCQQKILIMSPAQCRAARALLKITQGELADAAGLGISTVVDFEKERRQVSQGASSAMRSALERGGIEFIDENGGEGVRRASRRRTRK